MSTQDKIIVLTEKQIKFIKNLFTSIPGSFKILDYDAQIKARKIFPQIFTVNDTENKK